MVAIGRLRVAWQTTSMLQVATIAAELAHRCLFIVEEPTVVGVMDFNLLRVVSMNARQPAVVALQ